MTGRYEVTGNSDTGLPVEYPMAVASQLGGRFANAFAPADGSIGKIMAVAAPTRIPAGQSNTPIKLAATVQDPIAAQISEDGEILLMEPGEWSIEVKAQVTKKAGSSTNVITRVVYYDRDGISMTIRESQVLGTSQDLQVTLYDRLIDVLVLPEHVPAKISILLIGPEGTDVSTGPSRTWVAAKKTNRYAVATSLSSDGS